MTKWIALALLLPTVVLAQAPAPSPRAQLEAAMAAGQAGKVDAAVKQFDALLRAKPPLDIAGQAHLELARIYDSRGDWWNALTHWEALRKLAPDEPEYAYQLGLVYQNLSKWAFERMHSVAPQSARVQQMVGEQLAVMGRQEKAIAAFRRAIEIDPKLQGSHLALAMIYLQGGNRDEAIAQIDRELEIAPDSAAAKQLRQAAGGSKP